MADVDISAGAAYRRTERCAQKNRPDLIFMRSKLFQYEDKNFCKNFMHEKIAQMISIGFKTLQSRLIQGTILGILTEAARPSREQILSGGGKSL